MFPGSRYEPPEEEARTGSPRWMKVLFVLALTVLVVCITIKVEEGRAERRKKTDKVHESIVDLDAQSKVENRRKAQANEEVTMEDGIKDLEKIRRELDKGANIGGLEGKALRVMSLFAADLQSKMKAYSEHTSNMAEEEVFEVNTIKTRGDIARRRQMGVDLLKVNNAILSFTNSAESFIYNGLLKEGASTAEAKAISQGYTKKRGNRPNLREYDDIVGKAVIEFCDLLDSEWGKWKSTSDGPVFHTPGVANRYNAIIQRAEKATADQAATQREMLNKEH